MVETAPNAAEIARRIKIRDALHVRGLKFIQDRAKMPLIEENKDKGEWVHQ